MIGEEDTDSSFSYNSGDELDRWTVDKVLRKFRKDDHFRQYQTTPCTTRNVLILGKSRSGKKTIQKVLMDTTYELPKYESIFADTSAPQLISFTIRDKSNHRVENYTLNMIHSTSFFDGRVRSRVSGEVSRSDSVMNIIRLCLEREITHIHCVLICCSPHAGIDQADVDAIDMILAIFKGSGVKKGLVFTRCEQRLASFKEGLVRQILAIPRLKDHLSEKTAPLFCDAQKGYMIMSDILKREKQKMEKNREEEEEVKSEVCLEEDKLHIFFMGGIQSGRFRTEEALRHEYLRLYGMRAILLQFIFGCVGKAYFKDLKIVKDFVDIFRSKVMSGIDFMEKLNNDNTTFGTTLSTSKKIDSIELEAHVKDMEFLKEKYMGGVLLEEEEEDNIELLILNLRELKKKFFEVSKDISEETMNKLLLPFQKEQF